VAFRLARREIGKRPWHSAMLALVLAIPAFVGGYLSSADTATFETAERSNEFRLGQADLLIEAGPDETAMLPLPPTSRVLSWDDGRTVVTVEGRLTTTDYSAIDVANPLADGLFVIREGRAAQGSAEAAVSSSLADRMGLSIGDTIQTGMPLRDLRVVGIIDPAIQLNRAVVVVDDGTHLSGNPRQRQLVALPDDARDWTPPVGVGFTPTVVDSPTDQLTRTTLLSLVIGFASVQVALMVGATIAVTARRRHHELTMVSAVGGTRTQISRIVIAHSLTLGIAGALAGLVLSIAGFHATGDLLAQATNHPLANDSQPVLIAHLAAGAVSVLLAGLAAIGPAHGAARRSDPPGVAHRAGDQRIRRRLLFGGLPLAVLGAAAVVYGVDSEVADLRIAVVGAGLVLVGLAASGPLIVAGLGRLASRMVLPLRLSIRHAARHQLRTGAAIAAVCAATAGSIGMILFLTADTGTAGPGRQAGAPSQTLSLPAGVDIWLNGEEMTELRDVLPDHLLVRVAVASDSGVANAPGSTTPGLPPPDLPASVGIGGGELIQLVTGAPATDRALSILEDGGAVAFYPEFVDSDRLHLRHETSGDIEHLELAAMTLPAPEPYRDLPGVVISPETAAELGLTGGPGRLVFDLDRPVNNDELAAAQHVVLSAQLDARMETDPVSLSRPRPAGGHVAENPMVYLLAIVSGLVTILVGAVAVGQANAETRGDMSTLAAIGGGPWIRRAISACQAGLVVGVGTLLGVIVGFAPAAGLFAARPDLSWNTPWWLLGVIAIGVPLTAMLGTLAVAQSRLVHVRRTG